MNKLFYLIGLPTCFVVLVACTFLIPKTYESKFVIVKESDNGVRYNPAVKLNQEETYDLGLFRTGNVFNNMYTYEEVLQSDQFIRPLLDMHVRTLNGEFEGTYFDYCTTYQKVSIFAKIKGALLPQKEPQMAAIADTTDIVHWDSFKQEQIGKALRHAIKASVDYETDFVTITCRSNDPLVSTMMAKRINQELLIYIENYQQKKMQIALDQLVELTEKARLDYERERTKEKESIFDSFRHQEVIYTAQRLYTPAFTTLSEPSFSFKKVAPSRLKFPLLLTLILGACMLCWDKRDVIKDYLLG